MNLSDVQIWRLRKEDVTSREHAAMNTVEIACNKTHMQLLYDLSTLIFFEYLILEDSGAHYSECTKKKWRRIYVLISHCRSPLQSG